MPQHEPLVVLGAGLTGLSLAYHLDDSVPVFERNACPGGLARTVVVGPYSFDLAPHLLHFRDDSIRRLVFEELGLETVQHTRQSRIFFGDKLIPYPFELNLYHVSRDVRDDCLNGLQNVSPLVRANEQELRSGSFHEYAMSAFGPGISNHYLLPYNRKIWDTDPTDLTCEWMRFLPTADLDNIRQNATQPNDDSFGYNTHFHYPRRGGIQELARALARQVPSLRLSTRALRVDTSRKRIHFSDGDELDYDTLVSTIPLNALVALTELDDLQGSATRLVNTAVCVVNVVIRGSVPAGIHWIYFPDPEVEFYRVSLPKHYFDAAAPDGEHIISAEVGSRDGPVDVDDLETKVVNRIRSLNAFSINDVIKVHTEVIPHAYCVYDHDRRDTVTHLLDRLRERDIVSTGRYGLWEYSAMEDALRYGRDLATQLQKGLG